jgi:hypothetical protein
MMNEQTIRETRRRLEFVAEVAERSETPESEKAIAVLSAMLATLDFILEEGPEVSL